MPLEEKPSKAALGAIAFDGVDQFKSEFMDAENFA